MAPLLSPVEEAGKDALIRWRNPTLIKPNNFFDEAEILKANFGRIVNCNSSQVAIIPSASYGFVTAIQNLPRNNGHTAVVVSEEFPSGYYAVKKWCSENSKQLQIVKAPMRLEGMGALWNEKILESINDDTAVVVISSIHWINGTLFDLKEIGRKCKKHNAIFVVDGTQSVGALPMDVNDFQIDALICSGYKWLMGPYSIGLAYYGQNFNEGAPIEETWLNRSNARDFGELTTYVEHYTPGAGRYNVGEYSNFILLPMLNRAIEQLHEWGIKNIQDYCLGLTNPLARFLRIHGFQVEDNLWRAKHLFGFRMPENISQDSFVQMLQERKIFVSVRGKTIRISSHLFNTEKDISALIGVLVDLNV